MDPGHNFSVFAAPEVIEVLNGEQVTALREIERQSAIACNLVANSNLDRGVFEVVRL